MTHKNSFFQKNKDLLQKNGIINKQQFFKKSFIFLDKASTRCSQDDSISDAEKLNELGAIQDLQKVIELLKTKET